MKVATTLTLTTLASAGSCCWLMKGLGNLYPNFCEAKYSDDLENCMSWGNAAQEECDENAGCYDTMKEAKTECKMAMWEAKKDLANADSKALGQCYTDMFDEYRTCALPAQEVGDEARSGLTEIPKKAFKTYLKEDQSAAWKKMKSSYRKSNKNKWAKYGKKNKN